MLNALKQRSPIEKVESVTHPELPGITIFPMYGDAQGNEYDLVIMAPNAKIALHVHETTDAEMFGINGEATVLSVDPRASGIRVGCGSRIFFEQDKPHGFEAGPKGFIFASKNRGIRRNVPRNWDYRAVHAT